MNHAFMIIAHNEFSLLERLIMYLDKPNSDIYIHIDKSVKGFLPINLESSVKNASIHFIERRKIQWGAYSQIDTELALLEQATKDKHDYYHLLSGIDIPLVAFDELDDFFEKNTGYQFIGFDKAACETKSFLDRIQYYYLLRQFAKRPPHFSVLGYLDRVLVKLQKILKLNRVKNKDIEYFKGSNWFSITDECAKEIASNADSIRRDYKYTYCADEVFLQTFVMNSRFKDSVIENNYRYIDWKRGTPYTFKTEDYELLKSSGCLWARKFSTAVDEKITDMLYKSVE